MPGSLTNRLKPLLRKAYVGARFRGDAKKVKGFEEMRFWQGVAAGEGGVLRHSHFKPFFTTTFGLDDDFFAGRRMLDIGCGPRGSLEWATQAAERVGLDPLVPQYRRLGIDRHAMRYVASGAEEMPFPDGHFDIVSSLNSLDHVDDLDRTVAEIVRVLKPGGTFLLITDVNHDPTPTEPITFSWDVVDLFAPSLVVTEQQHFEKPGEGVYQSVAVGEPYDHNRPERRYGTLVARLQKESG
ncbi:MAG: hypothetical protein QOJ09_1774 [Actinomycetota bacterium]|jgi:SAM-dependent methyltransferase|nr:hypothetical protein [Actinomycetota bacterium]